MSGLSLLIVVQIFLLVYFPTAVAASNISGVGSLKTKCIDKAMMVFFLLGPMEKNKRTDVIGKEFGVTM